MPRFNFYFVPAGLLWLVFSGFLILPAMGEPLTIARDGKTSAVILVEEGAKEAAVTKNIQEKESPSTRFAEWKAANDLAAYIEKLSGARPEVVTDPAAIMAALAGQAPVFIVGELALKTDPSLKKTLEQTAHPVKVFEPEVVVLKREGNKVFLAGTNDRSHYYAVVKLLRDWGCRWYLPTEFGEVVPERTELTIDQLDMAYSPPFEVRGYWLAWNGSKEGLEDFKLRNFMNDVRVVSAHALGKYTKELAPEGGTVFNVPITAPETAQHVADQVDADFAQGKPISLSMEDGVYVSEYEGDREVGAGLYDKYFQTPAMTDAFWQFYNRVAAVLQKRHPESPAYLGFVAYSNITLPPQKNLPAEKSLVLDLAAIDVDPNHALTDPRSPSRQEFAEMIRRWAEIMKGKMTIYDYDQGMLAWRDLPNPSHQVFQEDVKFYRDAGIMGVNTESRGATATVFTNLYFRGQLLWDPDADVDAMLEEFYTGFYGPLAAPMKAYWNALYQAWKDTVISEHEYYVIPAIYTPELVETLRGHLKEAEKLVEPLRVKDAGTLTHREKQVLERLDFTAKSFQLIDLYTGMWKAAAEEGDYAKAAKLGQEMLKTRLELAAMNPTFTTRVIGMAAEPTEPKEGANPAWLPGEIQQYVELDNLTNGKNGKLIRQLPLEWAFRRDPNDTGLARGFARHPADLTFWKANKEQFVTPEQRKDYPTTEWEVLRTDRYAQAQGVLHPDWQSFTGYLWYKTSVELSKKDLKGPVHLHFPGLFSEAWLYVNGYLVAHRPQNHMWWKNSYRFDWDVDLTGKLQPGDNDITLRVHNTHHNGGIFRRPFLYEPLSQN